MSQAPSAVEVSERGTPKAQRLQTEFHFELPRGFRDREGRQHKSGVMRLATGRDELVPLVNPRVQENAAYVTVVLLSRVITRLGDLQDHDITPAVIEHLYASDLAFLQDLYRRVNEEGNTQAGVTCPNCEHEFTVDLAGGGLGES